MRENIYQQFVTTIHQNCINSQYDIKRLREVYDETSIMECELVICATDEIIYTALHLK